MMYAIGTVVVFHRLTWRVVLAGKVDEVEGYVYLLQRTLGFATPNSGVWAMHDDLVVHELLNHGVIIAREDEV